jgi:hypothetical protein
MTETTPISFGTISAFADGTDTAVLTMNGQTGVGVVTEVGTAASIIVITAGTPGVITITSAPPSTAMTIADPSSVTLDNPATTGEATFAADLNATGLGYVTTTDEAGELVIQIGGTLTTEVAGMDSGGIAKSYTDGTYTGTWSLTVSY